MTPNDVYKTNPNAEAWIAATLKHCDASDGMEIGKCYFVAYANAAADDMYPMIFPYAFDKQLVALAFHAVPEPWFASVQGFIEKWREARLKRDGRQAASLAGANVGPFTRRYFPNMFKRIYVVRDVPRVYGLWLCLIGR